MARPPAIAGTGLATPVGLVRITQRANSANRSADDDIDPPSDQMSTGHDQIAPRYRRTIIGAEL